MTPAVAKAGGVLLAVFAVGVMAGVAWERHHGRGWSAGFGSGVHEAALHAHRAALAELDDAVDLDEEQIDQIHRLMARRQEVVNEVWLRLRPEVESAMSEVHSEIAALLRPEQRERYHRWLEERRRDGWSFRVRGEPQGAASEPGAHGVPSAERDGP